MSAPLSHPPLEGGQRVLATFALAFATFMNVLDTTIANVSLPAIAGDVGVSPNQGTWVITSFAVANAISVPLTGWLAQRFGQVRVFVLSLLLFVLASWLCGLSSSLEMLIGFRVFQGLVAGPMVPLSQALMLQSYPRAKAGTALAIWSITTLVAPVLGPILGGWISDNLSWPWIFFINIPTGLLATWLCWRIFRHRESHTVRRPVDYVGLGLLVIWVGALQLMLDRGKELDWFNSSEIVTLAVVAFVGFCVFIAWELTDEHPIVELRYFAQRNFLVGTLAASLGFCVFFGNVVILPLWMQQFLGYTSTWSGLATAPVGILAIVLSPLIGKSLHRTDPRKIASIAFIVFALTSFMRANFTPDMTIFDVILPQFLQGIATACFFVPLVSISLSSLKPHEIAAATGVSNFVRITAAAFGTSAFTTLWERRSVLHHAQFSEAISVYNPVAQTALDNLGAQGMPLDQRLALLNRSIDVQSATLGAVEFFWLSGCIYGALTLVVWFAHPRTPGSGPRGPAVAAD
ncbi:MAG: DHA2 family efflux MFS transporter permease subunit [Uliginosibacterium sp.]|nr:DHA2 family efflux MFS transporter permease subunit [Uliginosibacterium sp.]